MRVGLYQGMSLLVPKPTHKTPKDRPVPHRGAPWGRATSSRNGWESSAVPFAYPGTRPFARWFVSGHEFTHAKTHPQNPENIDHAAQAACEPDRSPRTFRRAEM